MQNANLRLTIDVGLLQQATGWIFVGVPVGHTFHEEPLFSGKRKTLEQAINAAKELVPSGAIVVYSRLEANINEWKVYD